LYETFLKIIRLQAVRRLLSALFSLSFSVIMRCIAKNIHNVIFTFFFHFLGKKFFGMLY